MFAMTSGSVRLLGGQMVAEWDLEILNEAFLDTNAQFYVKLNSTYLVEGGKPLPTKYNVACKILCFALSGSSSRANQLTSNWLSL